MKALALLLGIVACALLQAGSVQAQEAQASPVPSQSVKITMIVTDPAKHSVDDIRQEELQLFEDKRPIPISLFVKDARPVDYALVIDTTLSFKKLLKSVVQAAKTLINSNHPEDETLVVSFVNRDQMKIVEEFTKDKTKLGAALDSLRAREGQSAVIDAIYEVIKFMAENKSGLVERRRAVVVFTDGEDRDSFYNEDQLVKLLRENDVQVFIVGITKELDKEGGLIRVSPRDKAEGLINKIAEASGGRVFSPRDDKETSEAVEQIAHDLHVQYLIGFERPAKPGEKGYRRFKVKLTEASGRKKLTVITRPGYLLNVEKKSP